MRFTFAFIAVALFLTAASAASLPRETIVIDTKDGPARFKVEIAGDPASQARGLMFRTSMALDAGMLFDFHTPQITNFWMKNTILPLDMLFVRQDGTISSIAADATPYSLDIISSLEPVRAVIELKAGRAYYLGIEPGDRVHAAIFPEQ
jgi:uncharacterized membrane protein (UPF0127 family)